MSYTHKILNLSVREKSLLHLGKVFEKLHLVTDIKAILTNTRSDILNILDAEEVVVYIKDEQEQKLFTYLGSDQQKIKHECAINYNNLIGYVALKHISLIIKDVYDAKELHHIDYRLSFTREQDIIKDSRTTQTLIVPIFWGQSLLGVLQIINKKNNAVFNQEDLYAATKIAHNLATIFHDVKISTEEQHKKYCTLLQRNILTKKELNKALQIAKEKNTNLENILVNNHNIEKEVLRKALGSYYKVPTFEFTKGLKIPYHILSVFNSNYLRENLWVPFQNEKGELCIAIDNPFTLYKLDDIKKYTSFSKYTLFVALPDDILKTIDYFWGPEKKTLQKETGAFQRIINEVNHYLNQEPEKIEHSENAIVKMVNQMIKDAYDQGASDIYIEPCPQDKEPLIIRFRIDGICYEYNKIPCDLKKSIISRIKIMSELDIANHLTPQDGKIQFRNFSEIELELRVAIIPVANNNESAVLRLLAAKEPIPIDKLGMSTSVHNNFLKLIQKAYGILLVVGPTGSGKTTTLHSALGFVNTPNKKIWTAEDPIEITQKGLSQVQINNKAGLTFARSMRAFLRAAPDIIMIGEMRDHETAAIAIEASLTGHLVLSTLHTNSAPETITRLIDMDIDPFNFGDALLGILAQRLVRTLCNFCKEPIHIEKDLFDALLEEYHQDSPIKTDDLAYTLHNTLYQAHGCEKCSNGLKGRMGIHELLINTREITRLIHKKATIEEIRNLTIREGMRTLKQDGIAKAFQGFTDMHQVRSVCLK